jgi:hypothetical protein
MSVAPHFWVQLVVVPPLYRQPIQQRQAASPAQEVTAGQHCCLVHVWQAVSPAIGEQTLLPELEDAEEAEDDDVGVVPHVAPHWALMQALKASVVALGWGHCVMQ